MKRLKTILLFLVICISCFGQKSASKFDDLIISKSFIPRDILFGNVVRFSNILEELDYIKFNIAIDKKKGSYYCVVNIFSKSKYYSIDNQTLPHLLLKTDSRELVDLKADKDEPVQFEQQSGKYVTKLILFIPNIREFVSKDYIKCRVWLRERLYSDFENDIPSLFDVYIGNTGSRSRMLEWREKEVTSKYKEYKEALEYEKWCLKKEEEFSKKIKKINDPLYYDF